MSLPLQQRLELPEEQNFWRWIVDGYCRACKHPDDALGIYMETEENLTRKVLVRNGLRPGQDLACGGAGIRCVKACGPAATVLLRDTVQAKEAAIFRSICNLDEAVCKSFTDLSDGPAEEHVERQTRACSFPSCRDNSRQTSSAEGSW